MSHSIRSISRRNRRRSRPTTFAVGLAAAGLLLTSCAGADTKAGNPGEQAQGSTGTTGPAANPNTSGDSALEPFSSCDDLLKWVKEQALPHVSAYGLEGYGNSSYGLDRPTAGVAEGDSANRSQGSPTVPPVSTTTAPSASPNAPSGGATGAEESNKSTGDAGDSTTHSGTNNQEKGVDEPDTVKTDGDKLYTVNNGRLLAYADLGSTPRQAGAIWLNSEFGGNEQLMLAGDRLLVLSSGYTYRGGPVPLMSEGGARSSSSAPTQQGPTAMIQVIDTSDLANMKVVDRVGIDGTVVSARFANGKLRIITSSQPASFNFVYPNGRGAEQAAKDTNRKIVEDSKIEDWLPRMYSYGNSTSLSTKPTEKQLLGCNAVSKPKSFAGLGVLGVLSIDPNGTVDPGANVAVMGNGDTVYASATNLYVTTNAVDWPLPADSGGSGGSGGSGSSGGPVTTVVNGSGSGSSAVPPDCRGCGIRPTVTNTDVHKFELPSTGAAVYRASGRFDGALLNQFSMSEQGGILRAATTSSFNGSRAGNGSESQVVTMKEEGGELKVLGKVGGLGRNESIRSVRFIGDIGYVVTFRQTDPLYTIDLRDPANPRVAGELKILGYSAYLHPIGEGMLVGVGQDATETGRTQGTQVQLFDVSDPANPRAIQKLVIPGATSEAEQDHRAFLWWPSSEMAVIPVTAYGSAAIERCGPEIGCSPRAQAQAFLGVAGFTITREGIKEVGRIQHYSGQTPGGCDGRITGIAQDCVSPSGPNTTVVCVTDPCPGIVPAPPVPTVPVVQQQYPVQITRSVVAGVNLLTLSEAGLKASDLTNFTDKTWVPRT